VFFGLVLNLKIKRYLLGGIAGNVGRRIACHRRGVAADQIKKYSNKSSSIAINFLIALFGFFSPIYDVPLRCWGFLRNMRLPLFLD
jgi:hypothetical protein